MGDDACNEDVAYLFHRLMSDLDHALFLVSGRSDAYRVLTHQWLERYGLDSYDGLLMRQDGDFRPDHIIKNEIRQEIEENYNIRLVIDDRPRVIDMWRSHGITCLAMPWQDDLGSKVKSEELGELHIMVGPSGSGKTSYIWAKYEFDTWGEISSDSVRNQMCGDFKDQTKNNQVFKYCHDLIKLNITNGINTVFDATNIRDKDRKAVVNCVPPETKVTYIVIDRSFEEKVKTGGWRNECIMKTGQTLIEKHHETFHMNLGNILNGDGFDNVTVKDLRNV